MSGSIPCLVAIGALALYDYVPGKVTNLFPRSLTSTTVCIVDDAVGKPQLASGKPRGQRATR